MTRVTRGQGQYFRHGICGFITGFPGTWLVSTFTFSCFCSILVLPVFPRFFAGFPGLVPFSSGSLLCCFVSLVLALLLLHCDCLLTLGLIPTLLQLHHLHHAVCLLVTLGADHIVFAIFVSAPLGLCHGGAAVGGARLELQGECHFALDTFGLSQAFVSLVDASVSLVSLVLLPAPSLCDGGGQQYDD